MATAQDILNVARGELGYVETPVNRTKYGVRFGMNGQPWCDMFVSCVGEDAGARDIIGWHAYTPNHARFFQDRGQWGAEPRVGAIVFFDFPDSVDRIQHVGFVESFGAATITTIEGNTSDGSGGSQSNGGGVYERVRPRYADVVGYGYPDYGRDDMKPLDHALIFTSISSAAQGKDLENLADELDVKFVLGARAFACHAKQPDKSNALMLLVKTSADGDTYGSIPVTEDGYEYLQLFADGIPWDGGEKYDELQGLCKTFTDELAREGHI